MVVSVGTRALPILRLLTTGTLTSSDIQNHADYKGSGFGISGSGSYDGGWDANTRDKEGNTTSTLNSSMGYGSDKCNDPAVSAQLKLLKHTLQ